MELDLTILKEKVAYVILKTANGYVTLDPSRNDVNVWADLPQLLKYLETMET